VPAEAQQDWARHSRLSLAKAGRVEQRQTNMKKLIDYIKAVRTEWFKIVWPSRDAVISATIMILVFSGLAALFFFITDSILNALVGWIF
jgi:preprotein translocase SecE subunit